MAEPVTSTKDTPDTNTKTPQTTGNPSTDPNVEFYQWLQDKNYVVAIDALAENTPYLDSRGIVIADKPLLVVTIKKREDK